MAAFNFTEVAFLNLHCVLPSDAGFKTSVIKILFLWGLFTLITIFNSQWLQKCDLFMQLLWRDTPGD